MKRFYERHVKNIIPGDIVEGVSSDWLLRHFPLIVLILFFSLTYIALRFDCLSSQKQITELHDRLNTIRTDTRAEQAIYMSATGESTMLRHVEELGLDLHLQQQPPYIIHTAR